MIYFKNMKLISYTLIMNEYYDILPYFKKEKKCTTKQTKKNNNYYYRIIISIFTFMHLADAFIQSDLQLHSGYTFLSVYVFPGNRTHNLLRCWRNALPLSHRNSIFFTIT